MKALVKRLLRGVDAASRKALRFCSGAVGYAGLGAWICVAAPCSATTNTNRVDVTLQASVLESISLVVLNPVIAFGVVTPGSATNAAPLNQALSITTAWTLSAGETTKLYAYFDSASSAMTGLLLGDSIPTSSVIASLNGGSAQSFTQTSPFTTGATALQLYSVGINAGNALLTGRTDSLALTLNLSGISLHPDTYTGIMHLQAQVL